MLIVRASTRLAASTATGGFGRAIVECSLSHWPSRCSLGKFLNYGPYASKQASKQAGRQAGKVGAVRCGTNLVPLTPLPALFRRFTFKSQHDVSYSDVDFGRFRLASFRLVDCEIECCPQNFRPRVFSKRIDFANPTHAFH